VLTFSASTAHEEIINYLSVYERLSG